MPGIVLLRQDQCVGTNADPPALCSVVAGKLKIRLRNQWRLFSAQEAREESRALRILHLSHALHYYASQYEWRSGRLKEEPRNKCIKISIGHHTPDSTKPAANHGG